ncbi:MAG TPA: O-phosphoserine--tRNA ligase, partial [Candidatus Lokiarchaeia archaeon]|nr:O-phosphoserine--tRNA ligase [Candidatus Lokiarchaeia archaeon]
VPTKKTMRSHTTALWFPVLAAMQAKKPLPLQYFHIGPKFRREQRLDATHLYVSNTISIVVMAEEITLEDTQRIAMSICQSMGFENAKTEIKKATSKYYAPQMEYEIFVEHPVTHDWIEIGDGGFYSPVSCAKYGIEYPVFNVGFGVERLTMIRTGEVDIRKLAYPYFYEKIQYTDDELATSLKFIVEPQTNAGRALAAQIEQVAFDNKEIESPVEVVGWEGELNDRPVKVTIWERESNAKLVGKAAFNEIWVRDGSILGLATSGSDEGVNTGLTYMKGLAAQTAGLAEQLTSREGPQSEEIRVKMAKLLSDVNMDLKEGARLFITSEKKKIDIRGPVFFGARIEID